MTPSLPSVPPRKPIIGLVGGIGAGKSSVAAIFARHGCAVVASDRLSHDLLAQPRVLDQLVGWWGEAMRGADGAPDRRAIGRVAFSTPGNIERLNRLMHPLVAEQRMAATAAALSDPNIVAVVWDSPLLLETGLDQSCSAVVFVDAPLEARQERVARRGWSADELERRERLQIAIAEKRERSTYVVDGSSAALVEKQVVEILNQILTVR
jgi:dephospho-CoA kinase